MSKLQKTKELCHDYNALKKEYKNYEANRSRAGCTITIANYAGDSTPKTHSCIMLDNYVSPIPSVTEWSACDEYPICTTHYCENFPQCTKITCPVFEKLEAYLAADLKCENTKKQLKQFPIWIRIIATFVKTKQSANADYFLLPAVEAQRSEDG